MHTLSSLNETDALFGIGVDLVKISRIEKIWQHSGAEFADFILMPEERLEFPGTGSPASFLAQRFAAKEAIAKATGLGLGREIWLRDIGATWAGSTHPNMVFSERAKQVFWSLGIGDGYIAFATRGDFAWAWALLARRPQSRTVEPARSRLLLPDGGC